MEEKSKAGWGGARKGSGRKPKGEDVVTFAFRLEKSLLDKVRDAADRTGRTRSEVIVEALKTHLDK